MLSMQHELASLPADTDVSKLPLAGPPPQRFNKAVTGIAIIDDIEDACMVERSVQEYRRLCPKYVLQQHTPVSQDVLLNELNVELQGTPAVFVSAGSAAVQVSRTTQAKRQKALAKKQEEELFQTSASDAFTDGGYIVFSDRFLLSHQSSPVVSRHISRNTSVASLSSAASVRSNNSSNQLNAFPSPPRSVASGSNCTSSSDADSDVEDERASAHSRASSTEEAAAAAAAAARAQAKLAEVNAIIAQAEEYQRPMFRRVDSSLLYGKASPYLRSASA